MKNIQEGIKMSEITITIPKDEIIKTVERKEVSSNGQISVGAELRGKIITCYVVAGGG